MSSKELDTKHYLLVLGGTFAQNEDWYLPKTNPEGFAKKLHNRLKEDSNKEIQIGQFIWNGGNNHEDRMSASYNLANYINNFCGTSKNKSELHIVAHSHGGNVILRALDYLYNINLINKDGPVREVFNKEKKLLEVLYTSQAGVIPPIKVASVTFLGTPFFKTTNFFRKNPKYIYDFNGNDYKPELSPLHVNIKFFNLFHKGGDEVITAMNLALNLDQVFRKTEKSSKQSNEITECKPPLYKKGNVALKYKYSKARPSVVLDVLKKAISPLSNLLISRLKRNTHRYLIAKSLGVSFWKVYFSNIEVSTQFYNDAVEVEDVKIGGGEQCELSISWTLDGLSSAQTNNSMLDAVGDMNIDLYHSRIHEDQRVIDEIAKRVTPLIEIGV